jgi:ribosomal protein S27E
MSNSKLSKEVSEGFLKAATTVICPYCSKIRNKDNLYQIKPRIKCISCHEKRGFKE